MGCDMFVRVLKYDEKSNYYTELQLFKPGETYHYTEKGEKIVDDPDYEKVSVYSGRDTEMFDGMKDGDNVDGYGYFPWSACKVNSYDPVFKKEIEKKQGTQGYYDFYEINLAEMKAYVLEHPTVVDYDVEWDDKKEGFEKPQKDNPITELYERICSFISFADWMWNYNSLSDYKVVFYFNW